MVIAVVFFFWSIAYSIVLQVPDLLRRNNNAERFDRLMDRANRIFIKLLSMATTIPRNYIIDQANVYFMTRKHKLKPFAEFHKVAIYLFVREYITYILIW